jgi:hypothetical protein
MAGTNFNPSWSDSIKWNSPAGGGGFGGGVSPGSSFEPSPGFPSTGDSGFWQNQPTDPNYYNKGKMFLDAFKNFKLDSNQDKYQRQAQGGFQTGGESKPSGGNVEKIASDISIYTSPLSHAPFTRQGTPGSPGWGGALIGLAGAALAPFTGGASIPIAAAGSQLYNSMA